MKGVAKCGGIEGFDRNGRDRNVTEFCTCPCVGSQSVSSDHKAFDPSSKSFSLEEHLIRTLQRHTESNRSNVTAKKRLSFLEGHAVRTIAKARLSPAATLQIGMSASAYSK